MLLLYLFSPIRFKKLISSFSLFLLLNAFIYTSILKLNTGSINGFVLENPKIIEDMTLLKYLIDPFTITMIFIFSVFLYRKYFSKISYIIILIVFIFTSDILFSYTQYKTLPLKVEKPTIDTSLPKDAFQKHIFSTTEQNVLFIISDMTNGNYIGRMIEEKPELTDALSGFVWYPDCLSVSSNTYTSTRYACRRSILTKKSFRK